jgi:hypothetical protein
MFQNCSPVSYKATESDLAKAEGTRDPGVDPGAIDPGPTDPERDPADDPTGGNQTPPRDSGESEVPVTVGNPKSDCDYCKLLDTEREIIPGTQDFNYSGKKGAVKIASAKDVTISANNGSVRVENAASFSSLAGNGSIQVKSEVVSAIDGNRGAICVVADSVGKINNINGDVKISAKEVDEISVVTGEIKIFGGTVKSIVTAKNVCLYEGAQVLNVGAGVSVRKCD